MELSGGSGIECRTIRRRSARTGDTRGGPYSSADRQPLHGWCGLVRLYGRSGFLGVSASCLKILPSAADGHSMFGIPDCDGGIVVSGCFWLTLTRLNATAVSALPCRPGLTAPHL